MGLQQSIVAWVSGMQADVKTRQLRAEYNVAPIGSSPMGWAAMKIMFRCFVGAVTYIIVVV